MEFWNIAVPGITFLAPGLAMAYLALRREGANAPELRLGSGVFALLLVAALVGVIRYETPVKLELLWPVTAESSGYFEFSFQLHWIRYVWIFFTASLLAGFMVLDGRGALEGPGRGLKFLFLTGAFLFSAMAYLSENALLSLMFIEVTVFLLHAFSVRSGGDEGALEMISYFKRSSFIFVSLAAMLAFTAAGQLSTNSILLLGVVLYVMSFVLSKHNFLEWRYLTLTLVQAGTVFFLLGRVVKEDTSLELALPLSAVFAGATAIFSGLSLVSPSALGASFWMVFSFVGYLLLQRFSAPKPDDVFWGVAEAIGLAAVFAISALLRAAPQLRQAWQKAVSFALLAVLLSLVSGALPGVDIGGARAGGDLPLKLVVYGILTFLLSAVAAKALAAAFSDKNEQPAGIPPSFLYAVASSVVVFVAQAGALVRMIDIYGESPYRLGLPYLMANPLVMISAASLGAGLFAGGLLGANARFRGWSGNRERRMEDIFPRVDPAVIRWNERVARGPGLVMDWAALRLGEISDRGAALLQRGDRSVFADRVFRGIRSYGASVSHFARYFHSGNVRTYMFIGTLVTIIASFLFLWEGR